MTAGSGHTDATTGVYGLLRDRILQAHYRPGQVMREAPVADDLGVSRTPVREALIRLTENGLLERTNRGLRVRQRTVDELSDVYEACLLVEPAVAGLAALRRRTQDLAVLDNVLDATDHAISAGETSIQPFMDEWHVAVWHSAYNDSLSQLLHTLSAQLFSIPAPVLGLTQWRVSLDGHRELTEAIRSQDAATAEALMRTHLEAGRDAALRALTAEPASSPRTTN